MSVILEQEFTPGMLGMMLLTPPLPQESREDPSPAAPAAAVILNRSRRDMFLIGMEGLCFPPLL
jgi:hypothetical protein